MIGCSDVNYNGCCARDAVANYKQTNQTVLYSYHATYEEVLQDLNKSWVKEGKAIECHVTSLILADAEHNPRVNYQIEQLMHLLDINSTDDWIQYEVVCNFDYEEWKRDYDLDQQQERNKFGDTVLIDGNLFLRKTTTIQKKLLF